MAIVTESFYIGETEYTRTYSDRGMLIHGGMPEGDYSEATEPASFGRTYTETNIPIEGETEADEILDIIMGVSE